MKKTKFIIFLAALAGILGACNSDSKYKVTKEIESAFERAYPDASSTEWSVAEPYVVARFRNNGCHCIAWFSADAKWLMTETTDLVFDREKDVPKLVRESFQKSGAAYSEIYKVEFCDIETRYVFEIKGSADFFFFRENGEKFKKEGPGWINYPIEIPDAILDYISTEHAKTTTIFDADINSSLSRIEIFEENHKTLCFGPANKWLASYKEIGRADISSSAEKKLQSLLENEDVVLNIYQMRYAGIEEIIYGFKTNERDRTLYIQTDGVLIENIKDVIP